jgi:hypothetical protein
MLAEPKKFMEKIYGQLCKQTTLVSRIKESKPSKQNLLVLKSLVGGEIQCCEVKTRRGWDRVEKLR